MIRICYMVDAPYAGGAERYVSLLLDALDRESFEPALIARVSEPLDAWCASIADKGVAVTRLPMRLPFHPRDAGPIVNAVREFHPHIVHINIPGPYDGQMGTLAPLSRLAGAGRVVVTEHLPMVERLWKRALIKHASYCFVDRVVTVCHGNVAYLLGRQGVPHHKIVVVANAIASTFGASCAEQRSATRAALGIEDDTVAMVFVGSLIKRKGVDVLLDAVSDLDKQKWKLFIIGDGDRREHLSKKVEAEGNEGNVVFLGDVPNNEVERLLCGMDVFVLPSFVEGMPYVILEAMACGLPAVASAIYGIPEMIIEDETGLLFRPGADDELRARLGRLLEDDALRRSMGRAARTRFETHFTLDKHGRAMEAMYRAVLQGRPPL